MSSMQTTDTVLPAAATAAARQIPPAWPLDATVAVNPFLGQSEQDFETAIDTLEHIAGVTMRPSRSWFRERYANGQIRDRHLDAAIAATRPGLSREQLVAALGETVAPPSPLPTVAAMARTATGIDWPAIIDERIGHWAAGYFDSGQALWTRAEARPAWKDWRDLARHDLTPEIHGLSGFAEAADTAPACAATFITGAIEDLGVPETARQAYFHALLLGLGGWSQLARQRQWTAEQSGGTDDTITDLLAIRLFWDWHLARHPAAALCEPGAAIGRAWRSNPDPAQENAVDRVWQTAAEYAVQDGLAETVSEAARRRAGPRAAMQAAFCIDVRSEVFRRALEAQADGIETIGFAGFFGMATAHHGRASNVVEHRMPVLLGPAMTSTESDPAEADSERRDLAARYRARAVRAWGRFKLAAVSSFAFVESAGLTYFAKLVRDAAPVLPRRRPASPRPRLSPEPALETRIEMAESVLRAMSLTTGFARLVVLAGHGSDLVNNPHASALQCGACGGYSGEVNARLLASLLNDGDVRAGLAERGLPIPADTLFVGALHDTASDRVTLFDGDHPAAGHQDDLKQARQWLADAGKACRTERAPRLPAAPRPGQLRRRGRNWAETRPEWGLAGCRAFVAAPRSRTQGCDLSGQAFLHNYTWQTDRDFRTLELILTAPVVVASWINLQYYGSAVAPEIFGAGNKLLHNVVGGLGVVEGNGGVLRAGLPRQSVHDGDRLVHDPLRLTICIEAPCQAINDILQRHGAIRALFDNGWMHLLAMDAQGRIAWRYSGDLDWQAFDPAKPTSEQAA